MGESARRRRVPWTPAAARTRAATQTLEALKAQGQVSTSRQELVEPNRRLSAVMEYLVKPP